MQLELAEIAQIFVGGVIVGAALDRVIIAITKKEKAEDTLKRNFGAPSTVTTFTYDEAIDWIIKHDDLMHNGHEAAVFKVNNQTLSMLNKKFNLDFGADKYLAVVIREKQTKNFKDSLLVKYDRLDARLESELAQGNGCLVIE